MRWPWQKEKLEAVSTTHVFARPEQYHLSRNSELRPGDWVVTSGSVGIFHAIADIRTAEQRNPSRPEYSAPMPRWEIHLVDTAGATVRKVFVEPYDARKARRFEIPASRLFPGLPKEEVDRLCHVMGYFE